MLILKVHMDGREAVHLPLNRTIHIGRGSDNDLVLDTGTVSRLHARIRPEGGAAILRDLESRNGTIVHGVKIGEVRILAGESFSVGGTRFDVVRAADERGVADFSVEEDPSSTGIGNDEATADEPA